MKQGYSLVSDILRAANVLGAGSAIWKERETERAYRNPRGVGPDENQRSQLSQPNYREEVIWEKVEEEWGA